MLRKPAIPLAVGMVAADRRCGGVVPEHKPRASGWSTYLLDPGGWSRTAYDAARIGTWALLIVGAVLTAVGLMSYGRRRAG